MLLSAIAWCFMINVHECCPLKTTGHYGNSECFHHHCFSDQSNLTFQAFSISTEKAMVHVFILSISEDWDDPWGYMLPNRDVGDPGGILGYSLFVRRPWFFLERGLPGGEFFLASPSARISWSPDIWEISLFPENLNSHIIFIIVIIIKFHGSTRTIAFLHIRPQ